MATLQLSFVTDQGKTSSLSIPNAKDDLTAGQVEAVMEDIIARDIFAPSGGRYAFVKGAKLIEKDEVILLPV